MRKNLPVSNAEFPLRDDCLIVSKTNLKGQITYVNKDFLEASGFSEAELLGESHNIVRHPDMPPEAFADLWDTLKAGRPWNGVVKNRRKNGDHYWVRASVTPIVEDGKIAGYLSVRRKPPRDIVTAVEALYRQFREGRQGRLRIRHGQAVRGAESPLARLSVSKRMYLIFGLLCLGLVVQAGLALFMLTQTNETAQNIYAHHLEPVRMLGRINQLMADNRAQVMLGMQHDPASPYAKFHDHPLSAHTDAIEANKNEIDRLWQAYRTLIDDDAERKMAEDYKEARGQFVAGGLLPARQALVDGNFGGATRLLLEKINPAYKTAAARADDLFNHLSTQARQDYTDSQSVFAQIRMATLIGVLLTILAAAATVVWLIRSIKRPVDQVVDTLGRIAQGDYSSDIDIGQNDELGRMLQQLQTMQTRMGFEMAETRRVADEMTGIKIALDSVHMPVCIADTAGIVTYANRTMLDAVEKVEDDVARLHPGFSAKKLVGSSIGVFHDDPAAAIRQVAEMQQADSIDIAIGERFFHVTTTPVSDARGNRLGSVGEWQDRTDEIEVEHEVGDIVASATRGDLSKRIAMDGKEGFFATLGEGINRLLDNTRQALQTTSEALNRVARGDLTQTIHDDYEGIFGQLKDDTNLTIERLREVIGRIKEASDTIDTAAKEIAAGNQDLSSRTEEQASSLEETSSSMEELNSTVRQNAENADQANDLAKKSNEVATRGGDMVKRVVSTMSDIQSSSKKIADIVGVIDSIAFQTNILALNAAVEAARAGEQGRGFAVVASEVRSLAQRSATAAKEIKTLIAESVDKVESGARLVQDAGSTMDDVVTRFRQVADLVTGISDASHEQSSGISQVAAAVGQMDEVTQQNAALVEQAAAAAESLEEQARGLVQAVSMFRLAEGRGVLASRPATKPASKPVPRLAAKDGAHSAPPAKRALPAAHAGTPAEEWEEF